MLLTKWTFLSEDYYIDTIQKSSYCLKIFNCSTDDILAYAIYLELKRERIFEFFFYHGDNFLKDQENISSICMNIYY